MGSKILDIFSNRSFVHLDKYQSQFGAGNQMFSYYHEEDESSFQLVDTSRPQRPLYQRNRNRFGQVSKFKHCILSGMVRDENIHL